ncbi:MAG: aminoglycoside phosphotransferase family protein [Bacteroidales bacterium]|nr:aminoglycoside phosphotransferase family protein [Bacteroidales bacterium]
MTKEEIIAQFALDKKPREIRQMGEGFINDTFLVLVEGQDEPEYLLQRKNHIVFPNVPAMMDNIDKVSRHIAKKVSDPLRECMNVIPTRDGALYFKDDQGLYWAVCLFIKNSTTFDRADSPELARMGGEGLATFHRLVSDYTEPVTAIIEGFHNIRWRFQQWDESLRRDAAGRVKDVQEEIGWIESRRSEMLAFWEKYEKGEFPVRVTHNDTKISNFLFDKTDGHQLCAIDLDTMMNLTLLCDIGDALRSYTNTGAEDDPDLSKVEMSREMYDAYVGGYLSIMGEYLTPEEKKYIPFSGMYITYEQVLRFLMDYIDGDKYYKIKYPEHNLVRTRAQYKLLTSMERQLK